MKIAYVCPLIGSAQADSLWDDVMKPMLMMAQAQQHLGHHCKIFLIANRQTELVREEIQLIYEKPDSASHLLARLTGRTAPPAIALLSRSLLEKIGKFRPTVVHVHSFVYPRMIAAISKRFPTVAQDHGGDPSSFWRRFYFRRSFRNLRGILATNPERVRLWQKGALNPKIPVCLTTENPSWFEPADRISSRHLTGLEGQPIFLWIGHLNSNKDPETVLRGFQRIRQIEPAAALYFLYQQGPLLEHLRQLVREWNLDQSVHFVGEKSHDEIESYLNSSDFFVLGTKPDHRPHTWEVGGRSLCEALACGCIPLIADNPSFRWIAGKGLQGMLFEPGNDRDMFDVYARWKQRHQSINQHRREIVQFHRESRSAEKVAKDHVRFYEQVA